MKPARLLVLTALVVGCSPGPVPAPPSPSPDTTPQVQVVNADPGVAPGPQDLDALAKAAWSGRTDRASTGRAIDAWLRTSEARPTDPEPLLALSRAYVLLADFHLRAPADIAQRADALERAIDAAERALLLASPAFAAAVKKGTPIDEAIKVVEADKARFVAVYGMSLARYALDKGFTALLMYKGRMIAAMQRVIEVAPVTFHAAADRELGAYYARVPGFAGGDLAKSKEHFEKATSLAPEALETRLRYAETYAVEAKNRELFARLLAEVKAADVGDAELAPDNALVKQRAEALAGTIDELFVR